MVGGEGGWGGVLSHRQARSIRSVSQIRPDKSTAQLSARHRINRNDFTASLGISSNICDWVSIPPPVWRNEGL